MSLLPSRGPDASTTQEGEMQVVGVDEDVEPIIDALSSETARAVLNAIYEEPGTPSEIADRLEMSIQKVSYHLDKLEDRDLIAVAGTRYSEKGQEMKVYEPPEDPLVLFVGTRERKDSLKTMVKRLLPTVGILALASLLVQQLFGPRSAGDAGGADGGVGAYSDDAGGDDGGYQVAEATETPAEDAATPSGGAGDGGGNVSVQMEEADAVTEAATETARSGDAVAETAGSAVMGLPPGLAFFLGGLLVLTVVVGWWAYRTYA